MNENKTQVYKLPKWSVSPDSYHYNFQGNRAADGNIYSFNNVTYQQQSLNLKYFYSPTLVFSLVGNYARKYAETFFLGTLYNDSTEGLADTLVNVTKTFAKPSGLYIINFGLSLPTGAIDKKNKSAPELNYPYNMQLGTGTYDFNSSFTYLKMINRQQIGFTAAARNHTGLNDMGYRRGDNYTTKAWYGYKINKYITPGVWINHQYIDGLSGEDRTFGRNIFVEFYHNSRQFWDLTAYANVEFELSQFIKLKAMAGVPLWQGTDNVDNVELFLGWFGQIGFEGTF